MNFTVAFLPELLCNILIHWIEHRAVVPEMFGGVLSKTHLVGT